MTQGQLYWETAIPSTALGHNFLFQAMIAHKIWIKSPRWCTNSSVMGGVSVERVCVFCVCTCVWLRFRLFHRAHQPIHLCSAMTGLKVAGVTVVNGVSLSKHWDTSKWVVSLCITTVKAWVNVRKHRDSQRTEGRTSVEMCVLKMFLCSRDILFCYSLYAEMAM